MNSEVLTREMILNGGLDEMIAREAPLLRILTSAEREKSLIGALAAKPDGDVWLFAYGSLIWNPAIVVEEARVAKINGWHRSFCLSIVAGRGSVKAPGLVLGLDEGGSCEGVAFRIGANVLESELRLLWRREMLTAGYIPRWVEVFDTDGRAFGRAVTFTIDPAAPSYAGHLTQSEIVRRLSSGRGHLGTSAEYLFQTCRGLRASGIPDVKLENIAKAVNEVVVSTG